MSRSKNSGRGCKGSMNRNREYWSPRLRGMHPWGRFAKWLTHRKERRAAARMEREALALPPRAGEGER